MTEELELNDTEMGVDNTFKINIAVHERMQAVQSAYQLKSKITNQTISANSNKLLGNMQASKQFETNVNAMTVQLKHCVTTIKAIDKEFPEAKDEMRKQFFERGSSESPNS